MLASKLSCGHLPLCGAVRGALVRLRQQQPDPSSVTRQKKDMKQRSAIAGPPGRASTAQGAHAAPPRCAASSRASPPDPRAPSCKQTARKSQARARNSNLRVAGITATLAAPLRHLPPSKQRTDLCATTPGPASRRPVPLGAFAQRAATVSRQTTQPPTEG